MERELKRQQRTVGAIVEIPLEGGFKTYARILDDFMAFYDIYIEEQPAIQDIIDSEVLFFTAVYDYVITKGYWLKVGKVLLLEDKIIKLPPFYTQDFITLSRYTIFENGSQRPAMKKECVGMEYFAVWKHKSMEKRLNDHFTEQPNDEVEKMKRAEVYEDDSLVINSELEQQKNMDKEAC